MSKDKQQHASIKERHEELQFPHIASDKIFYASMFFVGLTSSLLILFILHYHFCETA